MDGPMIELPYRILNVFTIEGDPFSGNPLCVFEDGRSLFTEQMQALARQFNLSETTFILPAEAAGASARVRIFTPAFEMPFAGHPTLGTAHVVRSLLGLPDRVVLEMKAGLVEVVGDTLRVPQPPVSRPPSAARDQLAAMLGLAPRALGDSPLFVDTGSEQLVIPLATPDDVRAARPDPALLAQHGYSEKRGASMAYVWAPISEGAVLARFFFLANGSVVEDPATGSACANLGGWMLATGRPLPVALRIDQGEAIHRRSLLRLRVDEQRRIFVSGATSELGSGTIRL